MMIPSLFPPSSRWWSDGEGARADSSPGSASVRLLVYREAPGKTRKLYFDSDTVSRVAVGEGGEGAKTQNTVQQAGFTYRVRRFSSTVFSVAAMLLTVILFRPLSQYGETRRDVKSLGEMVYGNLPASGRSVGFKVECCTTARCCLLLRRVYYYYLFCCPQVHFLQDPDQQMWSTTFSPEAALAAPHREAR